MVNNLLEALDHFKKEINDNFVVGGSLALYQHGFDIVPHDIDLELETTDEEIVKRLELLNATFSDFPSACHYPKRDNHYRFRFYGVIFDVWVVKKIDYKRWMWKDYIRYADIMSVFRKKMSMQRVKDYIDLLKYSEQIQSIGRNYDKMEQEARSDF